jgi:hypothetical protein
LARRKAGETTAAALAWLRSARRPFFAWVHYYDPHDPSRPAPRLLETGLARSVRRRGLSYVDDSVGRLREDLGPLAEGGDLLLILTADHAEGLGDHREKTHGYFVYDSTVAVPLVFRWPGRISPAERDLPPRLIDHRPHSRRPHRRPAPRRARRLSLVPLLEGQPQEVPPAVIETRLLLDLLRLGRR